MNGLSDAVRFFVAIRCCPVALLVGLLLLLGSVLVAIDISTVYLSLLPWQSLWGTLGGLDKLRLVLFPGFVFLSGWYLVGSFKSRTVF